MYGLNIRARSSSTLSLRVCRDQPRITFLIAFRAFGLAAGRKETPKSPPFHIANRGAKTGQLLVVGPDKTYAVQAFPYRNLQSPLFTPGKQGYLLFADANDNEPEIPDYTRGVPKGIGFTRKDPPVWHQWVALRVRAMTLAGKHLVVAGPPDVLDPKDPMGAFEGRKGGLLRVHAKEDGKMLTEQKLTAPPVSIGGVFRWFSPYSGGRRCHPT